MKDEPLTKEQALALFGGGRGAAAALARAIGISKTAVGNWPDDRPLNRRNSLAVRAAAQAIAEERAKRDPLFMPASACHRAPAHKGDTPNGGDFSRTCPPSSQGAGLFSHEAKNET